MIDFLLYLEHEMNVDSLTAKTWYLAFFKNGKKKKKTWQIDYNKEVFFYLQELTWTLFYIRRISGRIEMSKSLRSVIKRTKSIESYVTDELLQDTCMDFSKPTFLSCNYQKKKKRGGKEKRNQNK